jgi:small subunit ribosomal protein S27e
MTRSPSQFIKVRCEGCKNEQVIFAKATTEVNCLVCGAPIARPTGGKARISATIVEVLN